ncbi:MAG: hypothetical protein QM564_08740 [Bergeyella sp.]
MNNFIRLIENNLSHRNGLELIEQEIKLLFEAIAKTNGIENANLLFKNLEDIQFILARAIFKDKIIVTPFLRNFVYDFDRIDDEEVMNKLYKNIKKEVGNSE